ncbi:O-antigen ligase family protein, partial [Flavobacteriaceae bacterium]|nr:O-antigen ligase family protein [Flavobacteriaceae bacterium]
LSFLMTNFFINNSNNSSIAKEIASIQISNESSSSRFLLWENALDAAKSNNFIGFGLGNWKIESLPYWNKNGSDYIVPYHAHNDFFELLAEIGIFGSLSYLFLFLFSFLVIFKNYMAERSLIDITIFSSLIIYFIDANLNFPLERATMQFLFILIFYTILNRYAKIFKKN